MLWAAVHALAPVVVCLYAWVCSVWTLLSLWGLAWAMACPLQAARCLETYLIAKLLSKLLSTWRINWFQASAAHEGRWISSQTLVVVTVSRYMFNWWENLMWFQSLKGDENCGAEPFTVHGWELVGGWGVEMGCLGWGGGFYSSGQLGTSLLLERNI